MSIRLHVAAELPADWSFTAAGPNGFHPGAVVVLVPSRRHARSVREALGGGLGSRVLDYQSFADEIVRHHDSRHPLGDGERRLLVDSVLAKLARSKLPAFQPVAASRGFFESVLGYLAELKEAGIDPAALRAALGSNARPEQAQAALIFEEYQKQLAKGELLDEPDRLRRAAELWAEGHRGPFDRVESIVAAGASGLGHLERRLLDSLRATAETRDAGTDPSPPARPRVPVHLIEAPGRLGEARLVARHVHQLLVAGARPERILVVARTLDSPLSELYREVFDEYAIPHDAEHSLPLGRAPAVSFLLRAWQLPIDGWEFAPLAAVLRSTFFRPDWPEVRGDPEIAAKTETLLRRLGEPRGRESFLRAVAEWEREPPAPFEDEERELGIRTETHRLAKQCRPFLDRFFRAWNRFERIESARDAVARLREIAGELGLHSLPEGERGQLEPFWAALEDWARAAASPRAKELTRQELDRALRVVADTPERRGSLRTGVQILAAQDAAGLPCDHLVLVGMGEGSWPALAPPRSLLGEAERTRLHEAGFGVQPADGRLDAEQKLFDRLVAAPGKGLVLSYAAVDERGQMLLRSSFLRELIDALPAESITRTSRRMVLDKYFDQEARSMAELRVQFARWNASGCEARLGAELVAGLARARAAARARFDADDYTPFDGRLAAPAAATEIAAQFGPQTVFSPTALERYVACPFRFWLHDVLRLQTLDDPVEHVEATRRGAAFHRALARLHRRLNDEGTTVPEDTTERLLRELDTAVNEYTDRAPSAATKELWRLEGLRLRRAAKRYRKHWQEFREQWAEKKVLPQPHHFEERFGDPRPLRIAVGGIDVLVGGTVDRVDLAEVDGGLGFWIIDYKTGRASTYSPGEVERLERLQLPLYALAVERVLLKDRPARPLGLAYWLVTDTGPKPMLPSKKAALSWLDDPERWTKFRGQLEEWVAALVTQIRAGDFRLARGSEHCTDTCDFGPVCRIAQSRNAGKPGPLELPVVKAT